MTLTALSFALAALAVALAWPVPILLDRARWPSRAPALTLLLWQAIALAGGLSMIGSLVVFGLAPFGDSLPSAIATAVTGAFTWTWQDGFTVFHAAALVFGALLFAHLTLSLIVTTTRTVRGVRRHRELLELLSNPAPGDETTRIVDDESPFAYCLPGMTDSVTVLSDGLIRQLTPTQLRAVVEHERAHLQQRHNIVLTLFAAWAIALPWFPVATRARRSVELLIEMLADDMARRTVPARDVAEAIKHIAVGSSTGGSHAAAIGAPAADDDADESDTGRPLPAELRIRRLLAPPEPLPIAGRFGLVAVSVLLVGVPTVAML
ncbi:M56 family metallopeptidase [uncultured Agrococcus sp.]|uniref:M56 family metallopeptidase n=1 Tax=uncultured Agrococcus sp. TaxID=382258 RepID=UPI0025D45545|nr:M56 family metallopeptidase [uncultured Agrococcus sp.]